MKYLKHFESIDTKLDTTNNIVDYKVGDYILLDVEKINKQNNILGISTAIDESMAKITSFVLDEFIKNNEGYPYGIEFYNGKKQNVHYIKYEEILRKLNKSEIEEFDAKKDSLKYNL